MQPTIPTYPDLLNKVALITGIGQTPVAGISDDVWGNGAAIAYILAHNGVKLFGCDVNLEAAKRTADRLRASVPDCAVDVVTGDVTVLADIQRVAEACMSKYGRVDILVNNVGMTRSGDPVSMEEDTWDRQIDLNLKSVFLTSKMILPIMKQQTIGRGGATGGVIINNASLTAIRYIGKPQIAYASAKAAVVQFTKHMACMWAEKGVRANCVVPGLIRTPLVEGLRVSDNRGDNQAYRSITEAKVPMQHLGDAFDVANAVAFLCSDAARYITGHDLVVDGGISCSAG